MFCPYCGSDLSKVVDKRSVNGLGQIRRRRECLKCAKRFTTYEKLGELDLIVIKKDGRREVFNPEKLRLGIIKALEKRPALDQAEEIVNKIERKLRGKRLKEVSSKIIGTQVLLELKKLDMVAYMRFASVYRQFGTAQDFAKELEGLHL